MPEKLGDEPMVCGKDWVEWGGESIWAAGFTAGGAPFGLTVEQFGRASARFESRSGWSRAKALLSWAFGACSSPDTGVEVGRIRNVGDGLYRTVYGAYVELSPDPNQLTGSWVVLLPKGTPDATARSVSR